jgi:hypothetical protein
VLRSTLLPLRVFEGEATLDVAHDRREYRGELARFVDQVAQPIVVLELAAADESEPSPRLLRFPQHNLHFVDEVVITGRLVGFIQIARRRGRRTNDLPPNHATWIVIVVAWTKVEDRLRESEGSFLKLLGSFAVRRFRPARCHVRLKSKRWSTTIFV